MFVLVKTCNAKCFACFTTEVAIFSQLKPSVLLPVFTRTVLCC